MRRDLFPNRPVALHGDLAPSTGGLHARWTWMLILLVARLVLAAPASAQPVRVVASVDQTSPTTDDDVRYDVEVIGAPPADMGQPRLPDLVGLAPVSRFPEVTRVEGTGITPRVRYRWTLRPTVAGRARISEAFVSVGGDLKASNPVTLTVRPGASMPAPGDGRPPDAPRSRLETDDIFVRARVVPGGSVWQGEQVVVEWRLFARPDLDLQYRITSTGDAPGFWREDLSAPPGAAPSLVTIGGRRYSSLVIRRVALFPQQAGALSVAPIRVEGTARVPVGARLFGLDDAPRIDETFSRESDAATVRVVERPPPPPSFSGLTGRVALTADVDRRAITVGEGVEITVTVSGDASLSTMPPPPLVLPDSLAEVFDARADSTRRAPGERFAGSRTFVYTVVPRAEGTLALPPVEVVSFDPRTRRYRTARVGLGTVAVGPGVVGPGDAADNSAGDDAQSGGGDSLRQTTDPDRRGGSRTTLLVAALVAGLALMGAGAWLSLRRRRPAPVAASADAAVRAGAVASRAAASPRKTALPAASTSAPVSAPRPPRPDDGPTLTALDRQSHAALDSGDVRGAAAVALRVLDRALATRLGRPHVGATAVQLAASLAAADIDAPTRDRVLALRTRLGSLPFAPAPPPPDALRPDLAEAFALARRLDPSA